MQRRVLFVTVVLSGLLVGATTTHAQTSLIVHEWGTITTRHAPDGTPQGRLNRIEPTEVLPDFVHRFEPEQSGPTLSKGTRTPGHPDVTM
ncbi:MAG TPA: hypothetical protein VET48_13750 [Steroidobacteraceae bacterium]|nr:hypothetical protein [Steroidobacteraceae bacterium]